MGHRFENDGGVLIDVQGTKKTIRPEQVATRLRLKKELRVDLHVCIPAEKMWTERVVEVVEDASSHVLVEIDLPGYSEKQMKEDLEASDANGNGGRVLHVGCFKERPFVEITVQPRHIVYPDELGLVYRDELGLD